MRQGPRPAPAPLRDLRLLPGLRRPGLAHRGHSTLWLVEDDPSTWSHDVETMHPLLCLPCAEIAVRECPHLQGGCYAVRVRDPKPFGVMGTFYTFNRELGRFEIESGETTYDRADRFSVVAHQMIVQLSGCTLIDLKQELRHG